MKKPYSPIASRVVVGLGLLAGLCFQGCNHHRNDFIIRTKSANPLVKNGIAFETTVFNAANVVECVVPESASVEYSHDKEGVFQIDVRKELLYMGHPGEPVSIEDSRQRMGVARRQEGEVLFLAPYGEAANPHGGQRVNLTIRVPRSVERITRSADYELPDGDLEFSRLKFKNSASPPWCEDAETKEKWEVIETHPINQE